MKKLITSILAIAMVMSSISAFAKDYSNYPQKFWDVPKNHWAYAAVSELIDRGVINGYEDGSFKPDRTVDRGEWAKMMCIAGGLRPEGGNVFQDLRNHWAKGYVAALTSANSLPGYYTDSNGVNSYKPDQAAVREDVTVSMVRLKGYDIDEADYSDISSFRDGDSISNDLKKYVAVAVKKGLINGYEDNTFRGQDTLTRAEAAAIINRAFQVGSDNKVADAAKVENTSSNNKSEDKSEPAVSTPDNKQEDKNTTAATNTNTNTTVTTQTETKKPTKPYKIETLKSANISDFVYDGSNIYYLSGNKVYRLDPKTGKASSIYDASKLKIQETKTEEKEVTKTVAVDDEDEDEDIDNDEKDTSQKTVEVTETVQEEVVVKEYSEYEAEDLYYDKYNDRLILTGYYTSLEELFKPTSNPHYNVKYDITNDEMYNGVIGSFVSKDKAIIYGYDEYRNGGYYLYNTETMSKLAKVDSRVKYWTIGNDIYGYKDGNSYYDYTYSRYRCNGNISKYNFSDEKFDHVCQITGESRIGIVNDIVYYWNHDESGNFAKVNLSTGKYTTLDITSDSEKCEVKDMAAVSNGNILRELVPVSESCFVFYDSTAKAFRKICENK